MKRDDATFSCGICRGGQSSATYEAREMMFGLRTRFHYEQCARCGTLWLTDPPQDYSPYYPEDYYSFENSSGGAKRRIRAYLRAKRDLAYFQQRALFGRILARRYQDSALLAVSKLHARKGARILDVGCGSGSLLRRMAAIGFRNLAGVDPFLSKDVSYGANVKIRKCKLGDLIGEKYDVVMFHHSLEHMENPLAVLQVAAELMAPGGSCLVRMPVVAYAWEKYGTNWVQLDPPRHMWLPTDNAMKALAKSAGLHMKRLEYDSTEFQFWGSELYVRDVPFAAVAQGKLTSYFHKSEISKFREEARALNRNGRGDSAMFVLSVELG